MRHKKNFNHLGRKSAHRKAMLSNMASSLILHKRIETTTAKAKALKRYVEPLITRSKEDSTHSRRVVFSYLQDKEAVAELFREVGAKVADRPGGYTRIIRLGNRQGDNADICLIELVDFNENLLSEKPDTKKPASRRRRSSKPKTEGTAAPQAAAATQEVAVEEAVVEETPEATEEKPKAEEKAEEKVEEKVEEKEPEAKKEETEAPVKEEEKDEASEEDKKD